LTHTYTAKKHLLVFYPIHITCLDRGYTDEDISLMPTYFSSEALSLLQDPKNKFMLLIDYSMEGWDLEKPLTKQLGLFHTLIDKYKIPPDKIFFIHGNLNNESSTYDNLPISRSNICNVNFFEALSSSHLRNTYKHKFTIEEKNYQTVSKKFVCKNNMMHGHRLFIIDWLNRNNALQDIYWSLADDNYKVRLSGNHDTLIRYYYNDEHETSLAVERIKKLLENGPVKLDWPSNLKHVGYISKDVSPQSYIDSCFSLVTETTFDERNTELTFITEKTFKPISTLHPFLVVGSYKTLDYLKGLGYHTFPELFDESYDLKSNYKDRMNIIIKNLKKILRTPTRTLAKEFSTHSINKKLIENQERLLQVTEDKLHWSNLGKEVGPFIYKLIKKHK